MAIRIHFLNVGSGDCTIVEHESDRVSMIDINNAKTLSENQEAALRRYYSSAYSALSYPAHRISTKEGLQDPVDYYKKYIGKKPIFRFISTHPDMDHLSGLFRLAYQEKISILNFWHTNHNKQFKEDEFNGSPYDYKDWLAYEHIRTGKHGATVLQIKQGYKNKYFNYDDNDSNGDQIYIWAPNEKLEQLAVNQEDYNHISYVLSIEYLGHKIILGGDAYGHEKHYPENTWSEIANWLGDQFDMTTSVLKASHHGHENGYHADSVKRMAPKITVISESYGDGSTRSDLYNQWSNKVLSTFWYGNIIVEIDNKGGMLVFTEKNRSNARYQHRTTGYYLLQL